MSGASDDFVNFMQRASFQSDHPHGGLALARNNQIACYVTLNRLDAETVELASMWAPRRNEGGGHHAMRLISFLADLYDVKLYLVAEPVLESRKDQAQLVDFYRRYDFLVGEKMKDGVAMMRLPMSLFP